MIFEPCPAGGCTGKVMIARAAGTEHDPSTNAATDHAYCPLCRRSFERTEGDTAWRPAAVQFARAS